MNFAQLRAFHGVAVEGSFTRAAERLNVTQPTLSGQVKDLEQTFGVKLFERRGRGVALSELGQRLLGISRQIFGLEAEAQQLLSAARALTRGRLRVGADAPYHVLPVLAAQHALGVAEGHGELDPRKAALERGQHRQDVVGRVRPDLQPAACQGPRGGKQLLCLGFQPEDLA